LANSKAAATGASNGQGRVYKGGCWRAGGGGREILAEDLPRPLRVLPWGELLVGELTWRVATEVLWGRKKTGNQRRCTRGFPSLRGDCSRRVSAQSASSNHTYQSSLPLLGSGSPRGSTRGSPPAKPFGGCGPAGYADSLDLARRGRRPLAACRWKPDMKPSARLRSEPPPSSVAALKERIGQSTLVRWPRWLTPANGPFGW